MVTADSLDRSQPGYRFDLCGGHTALNFVNTVGSRLEAPSEHLRTYGDLLAWAETAGVVSRAESPKLRRTAAHDPDAARRALARALDLRETLYAVFRAIADGGRLDARLLSKLNEFVAQTFRHAQLDPEGRRATLATPPADLLGSIAAAVVRSAVDLLTSESVERIGRCADDTCGWLFLDTTRAGTRRWCDMKSCGNRSKVRRFRAT